MLTNTSTSRSGRGVPIDGGGGTPGNRRAGVDADRRRPPLPGAVKIAAVVVIEAPRVVLPRPVLSGVLGAAGGGVDLGVVPSLGGVAPAALALGATSPATHVNLRSAECEPLPG